MSAKYAKPYPKSYIILAIAFSVFLFGIWGFYGFLFSLDKKTATRYELSSIASSVTSNISKRDMKEAKRQYEVLLNTVESVDLNEKETERLEILKIAFTNLKNNPDNEAFIASALPASGLFADELRTTANNDKQSNRNAHVAGDCAMMGIFIVVVVAILFIGRLVQKKDAKNSFLEHSAENAKRKTVEVAYKDILTDCGNRFALEKYVSEQLNAKTSFCLAQLNIYDYSNLLSIMGYDKMDECAYKIAEDIKHKFNDFGTLYTMKDDEFVFVFNNDVTSVEASRTAENIRRVIHKILLMEIHIDVPVIGAVLNTERYANSNSNAILTSLHSASAQSVAAAPLPAV